MCGINGIYHHKLLHDPIGQVRSMNLKSGHRGPDHTDIYDDDVVVLGHNRLAIIDLNAKCWIPKLLSCPTKKFSTWYSKS